MTLTSDSYFIKSAMKTKSSKLGKQAGTKLENVCFTFYEEDIKFFVVVNPHLRIFFH